MRNPYESFCQCLIQFCLFMNRNDSNKTENNPPSSIMERPAFVKNGSGIIIKNSHCDASCAFQLEAKEIPKIPFGFGNGKGKCCTNCI